MAVKTSVVSCLLIGGSHVAFTTKFILNLCAVILQYFDTFGWVSGRASALQRLAPSDPKGSYLVVVKGTWPNLVVAQNFSYIVFQ